MLRDARMISDPEDTCPLLAVPHEDTGPHVLNQITISGLFSDHVCSKAHLLIVILLLNFLKEGEKTPD